MQRGASPSFIGEARNFVSFHIDPSLFDQFFDMGMLPRSWLTKRPQEISRKPQLLSHFETAFEPFHLLKTQWRTRLFRRTFETDYQLVKFILAPNCWSQSTQCHQKLLSVPQNYHVRTIRCLSTGSEIKVCLRHNGGDSPPAPRLRVKVSWCRRAGPREQFWLEKTHPSLPGPPARAKRDRRTSFTSGQSISPGAEDKNGSSA